MDKKFADPQKKIYRSKVPGPIYDVTDSSHKYKKVKLF